MALLRPLLLDNVPSIQQSAALALGRLATHSDDLAEAIVSNQILPQLVYSLSEQNVILISVALAQTLSRDSTKKLPRLFSEPSLDTTNNLPKPSLIQALLIHLSSALKNSTQASRKLQHGL
mgnify:FL=1